MPLGAVPAERQSTSGESGDQVRLLLISLASLSFSNAFAAQQPNGNLFARNPPGRARDFVGHGADCGRREAGDWDGALPLSAIRERRVWRCAYRRWLRSYVGTGRGLSAALRLVH